MAKSKSKKLNIAVVIAAIIALAGLALTIVGILTDWVSANEYGGTFSAISQLRGDISEALGVYEGFDAAYAFAIITIVVAAITFIGAVAELIMKKKLLKLIVAIFAAATIVCAIVALICTYTLCGNAWYKLAEAAPAIGAWLLTVGGVLCGLGGAYAALKG